MSDAGTPRLFLVYDSRAVDDVGAAAVMSACHTLREAVRDAPEFGRCVVFSYRDDGKSLGDERFEWQDPALDTEALAAMSEAELRVSLAEFGLDYDEVADRGAAFIDGLLADAKWDAAKE